MNTNLRVCSRCVMDTTANYIFFDENGHCNYCNETINTIQKLYSDNKSNTEYLKNIISKIKYAGKDKKYDCIIGLSGGVDSSYLAYKLVKDYGLRPLAIHVDNGWNSEIAVSNIHKIVTTLGIDLYTHVIEWEEFKKLQRAFLKASVVDLEMLSDHAIVVIINKIARQRKIKYFVIGANYQSESILPSSWFYSNKYDSLNIIDIYKKFGEKGTFTTYPFLSFREYFFYGRKYGKYLMPLSYMDYNKEEAKKILANKLGWIDYGSKHHESFITMFYQSYILPIKFNIDKRKAHLSSLICAGQITREEALNIVNKPLYPSVKINEYIEYFCKKIGLSLIEFEKIMTEKRREHEEFKSYKNKKERIWKIINYFRGSHN